MTEPTTRLVRASSNLLDMFGARTGDGRALTAEWGEPVGHCPDSDEYVYEPTFTASGPTEAERSGVVRGAAQWLSDAIADRAAAQGLGSRDQDAAQESYRAALKALRAALAQQGVTLTREPLDVARLAVAIRKVERENDLRSDTDLGIKPMEGPPPHWYEGYAAEVAREYAALASEDRS